MENTRTKTTRNSLILLLTAAIWGMAFVSQSKGMDYMHPFTFNGVRSLIGAASILVYTLAANVTELCADRRRVRRPVLEIKEGNAIISCAPVHGMQAVTTLVFDTVCAGFDVLQQQYPENLTYRVI